MKFLEWVWSWLGCKRLLPICIGLTAAFLLVIFVVTIMVVLWEDLHLQKDWKETNNYVYVFCCLHFVVTDDVPLMFETLKCGTVCKKAFVGV